jgi:hypothetical protein
MAPAAHASSAPSTWATWGEAVRLLRTPAMLKRSLLIAAIVGTILSIVNQASVIAKGESTTLTWLRVAANYVVPFIVSNAGALAATRRRT